MQEGGLDKDKLWVWLTTGTVDVPEPTGKKQSMNTERIAELSAMFCMELFALGTTESAVSQPAAAMTHPRIGRKQERPLDFTVLAANLWKQKKGPNGRVSIDDLEGKSEMSWIWHKNYHAASRPSRRERGEGIEGPKQQER